MKGVVVICHLLKEIVEGWKRAENTRKEAPDERRGSWRGHWFRGGGKIRRMNARAQVDKGL